MQTSERLIAYQLFSLEGYQRLREALMQQGHLFSLVVTEAQLNDKEQWLGAIAHSTSNTETHTDLNSSPYREEQTASSLSEDTQLEDFQMATQSLHQLGSVTREPSDQEDGNRDRDEDPAHNLSWAGSLGPDAHRQSFVLMCSSSLRVLLTVLPVVKAVETVSAHRPHNRSGKDESAYGKISSPGASRLAASKQLASDQTHHAAGGQGSTHNPVEYKVGLTFDEGAISDFLDQLKDDQLKESLDISGYSYSDKSLPERPGPDRLGLEQLEPSAVRSVPGAHWPGPHSSDSPKKSFSTAFHSAPQMPHSSSSKPVSQPIKAPSDEKIMAQKAFVLSWAKHLATSPEGDVQPAQARLENQLEQSVLLDQVITKIRHSLDLPDILKTTVAQVRTFLSADRLVLYQLDQFAPVEVPKEESLTDVSSPMSALATEPDPPLFGQRTHLGHVTYESRLSEDIPSVLNYSEEDCFKPLRLAQTNYLSGQPLAIDNVDVHYAHVDCLLTFLHDAQVKSEIIAPIVVKGKLWGLLIAHQCKDYRHWEKTEGVFLRHIAEHLAVAISQASLYQQVREQTVSLESCVIERTQNLHDALLAAESANITKGEFLSTMSHELRTPLTYIIGMSATLLRWSLGGLNDRQRSYLKTIHQSGEKLLDIINNILEFANVESGRSLLDFSDLSLKTLVDMVLVHHQEMADKQGVTLVCDFQVSPDLETFRADNKRLQQIISNLMDNAIKFTPAGGQVNLRVWRESQLAVFQIEDSGIGIPESQQEILFEKFKQLESPFQRQYSGTGLGLAMTKRLVELHGGTIHLDSQVGEGSTFSVRLPTQAETLPLERYQVPKTLEDTAERVVLLETDEDNAAIVCEMLTAAGYEVIWLVDSEALAEQLEVLRPVMLVADLALLSGDLEKIKSIQLSITALNAKVLALTDRQAGVHSPMAHHDILHKPIDPKVLLEKVRELEQV